MTGLRRLSRRRFLQTTALGLGAINIPGVLAARDSALIQKPIPATGELLPVIGMGTSRTFDVGPDPGRQQQLANVLQAFFDHGGMLIDSSPMYGNAEQVLGRLLRQTHVPRLFAATKVWTWGKQAGIEQMQRSMQRMGVQVFDLMQIHNLRDWRTHLETLREWKAAGKIRYLGITTSHGRMHDELEDILGTEPFDFVQFSYHLGNRVAEQRLLPIAAERKIAVLINRPFARGALFRPVKNRPLPDLAQEIGCRSWAQFFLKYVVSHPAVSCAIPATSRLQHMVDNMGAGYGPLPDAAQRRRMERLFAAL